MEKEVYKKVWNYKTLSELSQSARWKAIRDDHVFSNRNGFKKINPLIDNNLYKDDGRLVCITIDERNKWFPKKH